MNNSIIELWIHYDPSNKGFNQLWRSWTEPRYDERKKCYTLEKEALQNGDMFVHVDLRSKCILPKELIEGMKPGTKAKVTLGVSYDIYEDVAKK